MPIFDFKCLDCNATIPDQLVPLDTEKIKCTQCGGVAEKQFPDKINRPMGGGTKLFHPKRGKVSRE